MRRIAALLCLLSWRAVWSVPTTSGRRPPARRRPNSRKAMDFRPAVPRDAIDRGPWWQIYGDPTLDRLAAQVDISNQTLKASEAAYRQARALVRQDQSGLYPSITATASAQQTGTGQRSAAAAPPSHHQPDGNSPAASSQYSGGGALTWEIDVWGSIRRTIESDSAAAQASAGDLAAARLSAQADVAINYFSLRISDQRTQALPGDGGGLRAFAADRAEPGRCRHRLARRPRPRRRRSTSRRGRFWSPKAINRAQFEHAIAVLVGKAPAEFSLEPGAAAAERADRRRRHPVGAAGTAARHRLGRAPDGVGQRPDRRGAGGLLSRASRWAAPSPS